MCVCKYVHIAHVHSAPGRQDKVPGPLEEQEAQVTLSGHMGAGGSNLGPLQNQQVLLEHQVISPAPHLLALNKHFTFLDLESFHIILFKVNNHGIWGSILYLLRRIL